MKRKNIVNSIIFVVIGSIVFLLVQDIFTLKFDYPSVDDGATRGLYGFYSCDKNSIDAIFLGTSHMFYGVSPMELYESYGITSYNLATPVQPIEVSYWLLREVVKKQSPKAVVLDVSNLFFEGTSNVRWRYVIDSIPFSKNKLEFIKDYSNTVPYSEGAISTLFPIIKYHSRWNELIKNDFIELGYPDIDYSKGYMVRSQVSTYTLPVEEMNLINEELLSDVQEQTIIYYEETENITTINPVRTTNINQHNRKYLQQIQQLCNERGIELLLVKIPAVNNPSNYSSAWTLDRYSYVQELCADYDIQYWDLLYDADIGIDSTTDYFDNGIHLNLLGAQKITDALGKYFVNHYGLSSGFQPQFEADLPTYLQMRSIALLESERSFCEYFSKLADYPNDVTIFMAVSQGFIQGMTVDEKNLLKNWGIESDLEHSDNCSFIVIIDGNKKIYEAVSNRVLNYANSDLNGMNIVMKSSGYHTGASASIKIDFEEYALGYEGLNIVVLDKDAHKVIDSVVFNTNLPEHLAQRNNTLTETLLREYEDWYIH